jgi:DNA-binding Xre family transcriptional regulator
MTTSRFDFGETLREFQYEQRVSSSELARRLNVHRQQVNYWRGMRDARFSLVVKVCEALEVNVEDFVQEMLDPCSTNMARDSVYRGGSD